MKTSEEKAYENDFVAQHTQWEREALIKNGFNPDKLTKNQVYILLEPSDAPENYACDGEISHAEAKRRWLRRLAEAGLTKDQIKKALVLNGFK